MRRGSSPILLSKNSSKNSAWEFNRQDNLEFSNSDHENISFDIKLEVYRENVSEEIKLIYRKRNFINS